MQEQIIGLLARLPAPATMAELRAATGRDGRSIATGVVRLVRRRLVERVADGIYRLTDEGLAMARDGAAIRSGPKGNHTGPRDQHLSTSRAKIWRVLRLQRKASTAELAAAAGTSTSNVQKYLRLLRSAGYVARLQRRAPGGHLRWAMCDDTGPLSPVFRPRQGVVLDRNSGLERPIVAAGVEPWL